jgi:hypothetical protein
LLGGDAVVNPHEPGAIAAAADGVASQEPAVQGIAHISTILIERIEGLEEQIARLPQGSNTP